MRVFDSYYFNIIDKVKFKDTKPYLDKMLAETGFSYKGIGFDLYDLTDEAGPQAVKMFPALAKYSFSHKGYGLMSYTENWREGEVYADPEDDCDITALFSNVPKKLKFWFGKLVFGGVKWFEDSRDTIAPDHRCKDKFPKKDMPFQMNCIAVYFPEKNVRIQVCVCIEIENEKQSHDSAEVIAKLVPYLGEPFHHSRQGTFSEEEGERFGELESAECEKLREFIKTALPESKKHKPWADPHRVPPPDPKLPHVADKFTLDKAFMDTSFKRQKGQPNWLHLYACVDEHGFRYEAYAQKLSVGNNFRVWVEISGYNFKVGTGDMDYYVTEEGESLEILKMFALFCMQLLTEYSGHLAELFGDTPKWYNEQQKI